MNTQRFCPTPRRSFICNCPFFQWRIHRYCKMLVPVVVYCDPGPVAWIRLNVAKQQIVLLSCDWHWCLVFIGISHTSDLKTCIPSPKQQPCLCWSYLDCYDSRNLMRTTLCSLLGLSPLFITESGTSYPLKHPFQPKGKNNHTLTEGCVFCVAAPWSLFIQML